jgi:hypothetical protein
MSLATFGQQIFQGFTAVNGLRGYDHANRVFTPNGYELKPRFKFLFHVAFTINTAQIPALRGALGLTDISNISLLVKTVDLPKYTIATETLNQYNRKRVIQTKINYDPVNITFHDDGSDLIRNMWYNYYSYYYKDASQNYGSTNSTNGSMGAEGNGTKGFGYSGRDIYNQDRMGGVNDWGYIGESINDGTTSSSGKPPFFTDIRIFGFDYQHKYAEYVLINPLISNWSHDTYDYSQGNGLMQHSMTIAYETVKYKQGAPNTQAPGFANAAHYDTTPSPLARPGGLSTILGQGGLIDAAGGIAQDLQSGSVLGLIGAAQKAGTVYNTFKGKNLKSIAVAEATALGTEVIQGSLPGAVRSVASKADGFFFPTATAARNQATVNRINNNQPAGGGV